jgi:hypothetical protein
LDRSNTTKLLGALIAFVLEAALQVSGYSNPTVAAVLFGIAGVLFFGFGMRLERCEFGELPVKTRRGQLAIDLSCLTSHVSLHRWQAASGEWCRLAADDIVA